jgi:ABC-2 type transport system ATP-binding protein
VTGAALEFDRVTRRFRGGAVALDDVSWSIPDGARACLLGPNGAGKSTSIRLLEGALQPTTGHVSLLGAQVGGGAYAAARQRTGVVPQGPGMYADLSAWEYLSLARRLYGRGDPARMVEQFGLGEHQHKMLTQLSGGYQRRVVLAAALLSAPELLLLDEPTVGLDPVATNEVRGFLRDAMQDRTTLLCTHNLDEAEQLCNEVVILKEGRILVHESLAQLRERATPRLRLAARQGPQAVAEALRRQGLAPMIDGDSAVIALPSAEQQAPAILRALLAEGLDVYRCEPVEPDLESLFLGIVAEVAP